MTSCSGIRFADVALVKGFFVELVVVCDVLVVVVVVEVVVVGLGVVMGILTGVVEDFVKDESLVTRIGFLWSKSELVTIPV
jgi:hypothetical protein